MLSVGESSHREAPVHYKRYKAEILIYINGYTKIEVLDKQKNKIVYSCITKRNLIDSKKHVLKKYNNYQTEVIESKSDEEYVFKIFENKVDVEKTKGQSGFALFVKEINRLLEEFRYPFKAEINRIDGNLNCNLKDTTNDTIYSRIEKRGEYYIYFYKEEYVTKKKSLYELMKI